MRRFVNFAQVDLPLWAHGEGGEQPTDFAFRFKANNDWFHVQVRLHKKLYKEKRPHFPQVNVLDFVELRMGWEWEARIVERFCRYRVNGVEGWGVSEWHWRHHGGRPEELAAKDPEHTRNTVKYPE